MRTGGALREEEGLLHAGGGRGSTSEVYLGRKERYAG